jgi:hypothetical protein
MATTPNYGWVMPDPTDFVTDLPADFEIFGDAVDTTLDTIETKLDVITTEGDLIVGDASGDPVALPIGTAGQILASDGDTAEWVTPAAGGGLAIAQIASGTLTSGTQLTLTSLSSYDFLELRLSALNIGTDNKLNVRINNNSGSNYEYVFAASEGTTTYAANTLVANGFSYTASKFDPMSETLKSAKPANSFRIRFTNCKETGFTTVKGIFVYEFNDGGSDRNAQTVWSGIYKVAEAVSSIEFFTASAATFSAGNYVLWGA